MNDRNGVHVKVGARVKITLGRETDLGFEGWVRTIRNDDMFARVDNGEQDDKFPAEGDLGDKAVFVAYVRSDEIEVLP
jgi:hypothetical protein